MCTAITEKDRMSCSALGSGVRPRSRVTTTQRLEELRKVMNSSVELLDQPVQAFLITTDDDHQVTKTEPGFSN